MGGVPIANFRLRIECGPAICRAAVGAGREAQFYGAISRTWMGLTKPLGSRL